MLRTIIPRFSVLPGPVQWRVGAPGEHKHACQVGPPSQSQEASGVAAGPS